MQPGMVVEEKAVPNDGVPAERANRVQPADGRPAVAANHLVKLVDALGGVDLQGKPALDRIVVGIADQLWGTGVNLGRHHHAAEAPRGMLDGKIDEPTRVLEALAPGLLVPAIVELVAVLCEPARVAEHGRGHRADAGLCQRVDPAWERWRDV